MAEKKHISLGLIFGGALVGGLGLVLTPELIGVPLDAVSALMILSGLGLNL